MSKNYDNWERLVTAVLRREHDRQIALCHSRDNSISSLSSFSLSFSSTSQFDHDRSFILRERNDLPTDHSDLRPLDHTDWKLMLSPDERELVWRTLGVSFFLDQKTRKNCFLLGVTNLAIKVHGSLASVSTEYSHRFREVAKITYMLVMDIHFRTKTEMLSPYSLYSAYLVFKFVEKYEEPRKGYSRLRILINGEPDPSSSEHGQFFSSEQRKSRADTCMEIHIGDFYVGPGNNREILVKLGDPDVGPSTRGLTIEGIEFRPSEIPTLAERENHKAGKGIFSKLRIY